MVLTVAKEALMLSVTRETLLDPLSKVIGVVKQKVEHYLKSCINKSYDIIFIDPPYKTELLGETLEILKKNNFLESNKYLYFERSKKDSRDYVSYIMDTHLILKDLSIGDVSYTISKNKNL